MNSYTNNFKRIGVMDSGVGGISVLKHIHALLPNEALLYFADSLHAPYGQKVLKKSSGAALPWPIFLIAQGVKALVVACNTATAAAITDMRAKYSLPIIGMEPAVKPAAAASKNGIIGVLATVGTLKSAQFAALLESYGRNVKVVTQACVGLVECIERGELDTPNTKALIRQYCAPLLAEGADTIVLGCTHYPFVKEGIAEIVGRDFNQKHISLIDTGAAVAKQLKVKLEQHDLLNHQLQTQDNAIHQALFFTNSQLPDAETIIANLWALPCAVVLANDQDAI